MGWALFDFYLNYMYCLFHINLSKAFWLQLLNYVLFLAENYTCVNVF